MRYQYVGANVSPIAEDLLPATMLIKPALLSYRMKWLTVLPQALLASCGCP
jgi:hypothetical protein